MLQLKVIEESESPWANRTTIVRNPGKNRFCLDARKLNAITIKDAYPLQNIDGILVIFPQRLKENVFIYLDDLLVISNTFEKHLEILKEVANCLRNANLNIGLNKSQFCYQQLKYLVLLLALGV